MLCEVSSRRELALVLITRRARLVRLLSASREQQRILHFSNVEAGSRANRLGNHDGPNARAIGNAKCWTQLGTAARAVV